MTEKELMDLDMILADDDKQSIETQRFTVTDISSADWAVRKITTAQKRIAERQELINMIKVRLDDRLNDMNKNDHGTISYLSSVIEPWARETVEGQKSRTVKLISGSVQLKKSPPHVDIDDEDELIRWCKENKIDAVKVKESVSKTAIKEQLQDGVEIPGARIVDGEEKIIVKGA